MTPAAVITSMFKVSYAQNTSFPNIEAASLYNDKTMILGNNVKSFEIVIPDEAHESLNQPKNQVSSLVMNSTILVANIPPKFKSNNTSSQEVGTAEACIVPAIMLDKYSSEFTKRGLTVDSHFTYKDLRGGQKGTGPRQTLVTWTTPETNLDRVISVLKEITPTLPYS